MIKQGVKEGHMSCHAQSLIEKKGFDPYDQMKKFMEEQTKLALEDAKSAGMVK